ADDVVQDASVDVTEDERASLAGCWRHERHDGGLVLQLGGAATALALVLVADLATDPRLVSHDGAAEQSDQWFPLHGFADAVEHEPGALGGQVVLALD